jgi:hypothetical protein
MALKEAKDLVFLKNGGEMGELIRNKDWSDSAIGTPDLWPQYLRTSVSILLNSQFPMFVWWGPELITLYNDAYRPIAGEKHPNALGESGSKIWSEIWDVVGPIAEQVMLEGVSNWAEDQLLYINRRGYLEETYFTFSYSPIFDELGAVDGVFCACTETTEKVLAARKIKESERNLLNTILQSPVAMCILKSTSFVVEIANDRMFELWGRGSVELMHKPIFDGLPEAAHKGLEELLLHVYTTGETFLGSEQPITVPRNGKPGTVYVNLVYEPFRDGDGTISGIIAVAIDVTEQVIARKKIEESEQELQIRVKERTIELEKKNAELEQFAYVSSHDLQEPLRKIRTFIDLMSIKIELPSDIRKYMNKIDDSAKRMTDLIKGLLDYSRLSENSLRFVDVDLNAVLLNISTDYELLITQKNASVKIDALPTIEAIPLQMNQLFFNLLGNALKFTKKDVPPVITIKAQKLSDEKKMSFTELQIQKDYLEISVQDNGVGFNQEYANNIFTIFQRLNDRSMYGGYGIGLALCKKVLDTHKGLIYAEGKPKEGATFTIILPYRQN